jgi:hypothetical protein
VIATLLALSVVIVLLGAVKSRTINHAAVSTAFALAFAALAVLADKL